MQFIDSFERADTMSAAIANVRMEACFHYINKATQVKLYKASIINLQHPPKTSKEFLIDAF